MVFLKHPVASPGLFCKCNYGKWTENKYKNEKSKTRAACLNLQILIMYLRKAAYEAS